MSQFYILIVDDSPTTSSLIKLYLQNLGYEISGIANTAEDALQLIGIKKPDLVLMDIQLGEGMNGIEAADIIMNKFDIPVIYVTSFSDNVTLERAKQSLPYGFINKPFRDNDLRVNIEIALSRKSNTKDKVMSNDKNSIKDMPNEKLEYALLSEALDHLISGVIILDEKFKVYYKNKSAFNLLNGNIPISFKNNYLSCLSPRIKKTYRNRLTKDPTLHLQSVMKV